VLQNIEADKKRIIFASAAVFDNI